MRTEAPRVVVGVDDSPSSRWALAWAVGEARLRGMPLLVVHASPFPAQTAASAGAAWPQLVAELRAQGAALIAKILREVAAGALPDRSVAALSLVGPPGEVLVRLAREGDILVVGRGSRGPLRRLFGPSVLHYCARHARTTFVCVSPPPALTGFPDGDGENEPTSARRLFDWLGARVPRPRDRGGAEG